MLHGIADGLICGKLPKCPWCDGRSLELEGNLLRCYGYQNGSTHCTYKSCVAPPDGCEELFGSVAAPTRTDPALLKREGPWKLTPTIERALKGWKPLGVCSTLLIEPCDGPRRCKDGERRPVQLLLRDHTRLRCVRLEESGLEQCAHVGRQDTAAG